MARLVTVKKEMTGEARTDKRVRYGHRRMPDRKRRYAVVYMSVR
jgi:hypothetical protein